MLNQMASQNDDPGLATPAEVARALGRLTPADHRRLELIARARASGLSSSDWRDLLQESVARALEGSRRWPRSIPIVAFLAQTIRSIANDQRNRLAERLSDVEVVAGNHGEDLQSQMEINDHLRLIEDRFSGDPIVLALMEGLKLGETARETQVRKAIEPLAYDAARKRFWRGVGEIFGESK